MALTPVQEAQVLDLIAQQSALLSLAGVEATILSKLGATKVTLSDLPTASVIDDADLLLLRQGVTDKSVTGLTFKNLIPTVADASTTVKGVVEIATDAETQTGTDTVRAITPSNLSARTATETRTGVVELATDAEVLAGTDALRAVVPSALLAFLGAGGSGTNGYVTIPYKDASDGTRKNIIIQWGYKASSGAITFPIAFPTAVFSALTTYGGTSASVTSNVTALSVTGLTNSIVVGSFYWMAFGH